MAYKFSKILAHIACFTPFIWLFYAAYSRNLGADPQEKMLHELGLWALIFLLLGLTVTPVRRVLSLSVLLKFRRMLGLYAAFYLTLHILVFFYFYLESNLLLLWDEVVERPYVTVGMLATLFMIPLVITSTKNMQRRLGRSWKKLHNLVYVISLLAIIHYIWQSKADLNEPLLYTIWLCAVLGFRLVKRGSQR